MKCFLIISASVFCACSSSSCISVSGFTVESDKAGSFVAHSDDNTTIFAYLKKDPKTDQPSISVQVNSSPLTSYYGLGQNTSEGSYSSFYVEGEGFFFDDNLDGFPDRQLGLDGKTYKLKTIIIR